MSDSSAVEVMYEQFSVALGKNCSCQGTGLLYDVVELQSCSLTKKYICLGAYLRLSRGFRTGGNCSHNHNRNSCFETLHYITIFKTYMYVGSGELLVVNATAESRSKGHAKNLRRWPPPQVLAYFP